MQLSAAIFLTSIVAVSPPGMMPNGRLLQSNESGQWSNAVEWGKLQGAGLHLGRIEVLLALDVELAVGTTLQLERDEDARVLGNDVADDGQVRAQRLDRLDETVSPR